jgi:hypothetical protein
MADVGCGGGNDSVESCAADMAPKPAYSGEAKAVESTKSREDDEETTV